MNKLYLLSITIAFLNWSCSSFPKKELLKEKDQQLIDYLFSDCMGEQPGASVMVIKKGKVVHEKSYGLANLENKVKIKPTSNFRIASVTKQFTAMAIMILVNQGSLTYETKLTEIFPDFPSYGADITIRHLLSNQSGLVDYFDYIDEDRTQQYLDAEILAGLMKTDSTYFPPGSQYGYSNTGYAVLAQVIEQVTKKSFAQFMEEAIFQKLGMTNSKVYEINKQVENRVFGYSVTKDSIAFNDQSATSAIQGDGGIYCSIKDYYKWDQALYTDKILPKNQLEDAFYNWEDNKRTNEGGYGFGWYVDYQDGQKVLNHSGGTAGFEHQVIRVPNLELSVVVFSNRNWTSRNLWYKAKALTSIYSNYQIPMPMYVMVRAGIDQEGIDNGLQTYDVLKDNNRYESPIFTLSHLGFEYRRRGNLKAAEAIFNKATVEVPSYFGGYYGLGVLYKDAKDTDKAIFNYQKVLEVGIEDEADKWMLARVMDEIEKLKKLKLDN